MAIDKDIWKKSYMLEFVYSGSSPKTEIFTFAVPPESEDFDFQHRLTETKTFGGSIFDSYGNETIKINISGSTINNERKKIYKGNGNEEQLTGEEEVWKLRELISDANDIQNKNDVTIYLYDLSKIELNKAGNAGSATKNYWKIKIKDFRIKRDKSKPLTYNYVLDIVSANEAEYETAKKTSIPDEEISVSFVDKADEIPENPVFKRFENSFLSSGASATDNALSGVGGAGATVKALSDSAGIAENITSGNDEIAACVKSICNETQTACDAIGVVEETANETLSFWDKLQSDLADVFEAYENNVSPALNFANNIIGIVDETCEEIYRAINIFSSGDATQISRYVAGWLDTGLRSLNLERINNFTDLVNTVCNTIGVFQEMYTLGDTLGKLPFKESATETTTYYYVTFNSQGGSLYKTVRVAFGSKVSRPDDPTKEHYSFDDWYTDTQYTTKFNFETALSGDNYNITIYAKWNVAEVPVTFYGNGGVSPVPVVYATINKPVEMPKQKPTRKNYVFDRWYKDRDCSIVYNFSDNVTEAMTLYAGWLVAVTVEFISNGGSEVDIQSIRRGGRAVYPIVPTKTNCVFISWCSDSELSTVFDFATAVNQNIALYAKWELVTATVRFIPNGGSSVNPQTVNLGSKATRPECTKDGSQITAWCTDVDLTNPYDFNSAVTEDITLYAKWNDAIYEVTYDSTGGSAVDPGAVIHGNCIVYPAIPTKINCIFKYWQKKTSSQGDGEETYEEYDFSTPATGNITLYAAWFEK